MKKGRTEERGNSYDLPNNICFLIQGNKIGAVLRTQGEVENFVKERN